MLRSLKELYGYNIQASDGEIGTVHDFYFDEKGWTTRYLVVNTGPWFLGKKVLIAPDALGQPDWIAENFPVNLTRQKIKDSPSIDTALPISEQQQALLNEYFHWPASWTATATLKPNNPVVPIIYQKNTQKQKDPKREVLKNMMRRNNSLRSSKEVIGYTVSGEDDNLGKVDDIILDDESWRLVYIVLDTSNGLLKGKKTLIALPWINWISYMEREVRLALNQQIIEDSPSYDPETPITQSFEKVLYDYHGRPYLETEKSTTPG